ncbi:MAG: hypothetical protein P4L40_26800 [Terracidiphilus sp.]|nr:hypothetical protein [Terracidiphilus sp.]
MNSALICVSTAITFLPIRRGPRYFTQHGTVVVNIASVPAVTSPLGVYRRRTSTPFRYITNASTTWTVKITDEPA